MAADLHLCHSLVATCWAWIFPALCWGTCAWGQNVTQGFVLVPGGDYEFRLPNSAVRVCHVSSFEAAIDLVTVEEFVEFMNDQSYCFDEVVLEIPPQVLAMRDEYAISPRTGFSGLRWSQLIDNHTNLGENDEGNAICDEDRRLLPVRNIRPWAAVAFCDWLTDGDNVYRLPTETEWELIASNGGTTRYPWGNDAYPGREGSPFIPAQYFGYWGDPVGSWREGANSLGIHDLIGSVAQYCLDDAMELLRCNSEEAMGHIDPTTLPESMRHPHTGGLLWPVRGGTVMLGRHMDTYSTPDAFSSRRWGQRSWAFTYMRYIPNHVGFRIVRTGNDQSP